MDAENYRQIAAIEKNNWWYKSRRDMLGKIIASFNKRFHSALDAGCGVGSNLEILSKYSDSVYGLDNSPESIAFCSKKSYKKLFNASIVDSSLGMTFDLIICMDVLEHLQDDSGAIRDLGAHLVPGGILIISVPAHQYLWNDNDLFSDHKRRYELSDIKGLVASNNLEIIKLSYWNRLLLIPSLVYYNLPRFGKKRQIQNNLNLIPGFLNDFLYLAMKIEDALPLKPGLLNGVSIICVCRKSQVQGGFK